MFSFKSETNEYVIRLRSQRHELNVVNKNDGKAFYEKLNDKINIKKHRKNIRKK